MSTPRKKGIKGWFTYDDPGKELEEVIESIQEKQKELSQLSDKSKMETRSKKEKESTPDLQNRSDSDMSYITPTQLYALLSKLKMKVRYRTIYRYLDTLMLSKMKEKMSQCTHVVTVTQK